MEKEQGDIRVRVKNGVVNISKLAAAGSDLMDAVVFEPHGAGDASDPPLNVEFQPEAKCPRFNAYLQEVFPMERGKANLLQQFAGYILLPDNRYNRACILQGAGANGKSVFVQLLWRILGSALVAEIAVMDDLQSAFSTPALQGKRLLSFSDLNPRSKRAVAVLKSIIAGDIVEGWWKYKREVIAFKPTCKPIFCQNINMEMRYELAHGLMDRLLIIPFTHQFTASYRDPDLLEKLTAEKDGVFLWMLAGAVTLLRHDGFVV